MSTSLILDLCLVKVGVVSGQTVDTLDGAILCLPLSGGHCEDENAQEDDERCLADGTGGDPQVPPKKMIKEQIEWLIEHRS